MLKMKIKILTPLLILLSSHSIAAEDRDPVFGIIQQEPYSFIDEDGEEAGYNYEIASAILKQAGFKTKPEPTPMKRLLRNVKMGDTDCMIAVSSPFTKENYTFVEKLGHQLQAGLLPRPGLDLNSYDDLKGLKIGVPAGMTIGEPFDSDESLTKVTTPDYPKSAVMLNYKRIDVIMGALESIRYSAYKAQNNVKLDHGIPLVLHEYELGLICNNDIVQSKMVQQLKTATQELKANGTIEEIITSFFAPMS